MTRSLVSDLSVKRSIRSFGCHHVRNQYIVNAFQSTFIFELTFLTRYPSAHSEPSKIFVGAVCSEGKLFFSQIEQQACLKFSIANVPVSKNLRRKWSEMMPYNFHSVWSPSTFNDFASSAAESNSFKCPCELLRRALTDSSQYCSKNRSTRSRSNCGLCSQTIWRVVRGIFKNISLRNGSSVPWSQT